MKKKVNYIKGFTLVEVLLVMGIFIILTVIGFNGFLSIRESFIARENVELIIQDIESTKLKAMNMEGGRDATWIYGFGIDFTGADELGEDGDYDFFKWCSPVADFGDTFDLGTYGTLSPTQNILPNYFTEASAPEFNDQVTPFSDFPLCSSKGSYINGRLAICTPLLSGCTLGKTGIASTSEISTLINRETNQMEILPNYNLGGALYPAFLFFESLTGRAIIYNRQGLPQSYNLDSGELAFDRDEYIPLDIVLHRKRSDKFDLITVYPNSGEVIHHVYNESDVSLDPTGCDPGKNILNHFKVGTRCYERYGIDDEINSFRD